MSARVTRRWPSPDRTRVRPSLTRTLFASFLALTALVLVATLGLARWSFERGFYEYVRTLERYRLEAVADDLLALYPRLGRNWRALGEETFDEIVARHTPPPPRPLLERGVDGVAAVPAALSSGDASRDGAANGRRIGPRTALFDADGGWITGRTLQLDDADYVSVPLTFDGERVGELHATVLRRIESPAQSAFASRQTRASLLIGAAALALSGLVSWRLARTLLRPVEVSIERVARLSHGDYSESDSGESGAARRDELGRLAADIERLRRTLASARNSRRRLLADVSHELRTPLTILGGEIAAMKDGLRPFDAAQLASIDQEVERLTRLVEDLYELSVSDIGGLRYAFEPMDVGECLERAIETRRHGAHDAGIEIEWVAGGSGERSAEIPADRRRLEQLFANLLANAIAYTDAPGRVRVALTTSTTALRVAIEDTAPGVPPDSLERLFESLYRDDRSRSRRTGGAGLGLAICRNIVEAHGGRITAYPSPLGGLGVEVVLPRRREASRTEKDQR